jgi:hypothetical protein
MFKNYKPTEQQIDEALEAFSKQYGNKFSFTYRPWDGMLTMRKAKQQKVFAYISFEETGHKIELL